MQILSAEELEELSHDFARRQMDIHLPAEVQRRLHQIRALIEEVQSNRTAPDTEKTHE